MSDPDDRPPDFGLADEHEVGPAHIGLILFIAAVAAWFSLDEHSNTADWIGLCLFLAGCGLWALDPPPKMHFWKQPSSVLIGLAGVAYGWWYQRLPIAIAGALVMALFPAILLRRILR